MGNGETMTVRQRLMSRLPPRLESWWAETRSTLWFLPTTGAILAAIAAILIVYLDDRLDLRAHSIRTPWLFGAGSDGARGVLTAIAASVITVVGTAFSITIVGLQLASSQFTPRVLRQFTGDRINQAVLAIYIGTFTYCLLVLRTVQSEEGDAPGFVPVIGVTVAIGLALVCIALLILFIHHMAQQMQVAYILHRATDDALTLVHAYFREEVHSPELPERNYAQGEGHDVRSAATGYLQHYDYDHLLGTARSSDLTIRMLVSMGAYLNTHQPIARIWTASGDAVDLEAAGRAVRAAFVIGPERTLHADLPLGIRQIADIGIKALSPAVNDPTTATQALDRLSEVLGQAGALEPPQRILYVDSRPAVFLPRVGFADLTNIAFTQIRHYGKADLVVMLHLVRTIERIASSVQERYQDGLLRHLELVKLAGEQGLALGPEREALAEAVDEAAERIHQIRAGERGPVVPDILQEV